MLPALKRVTPAPVKKFIRATQARFRGLRESASLYLRRPRLFNFNSPERIGIVYNAHSDMLPEDRILLYALVRGLGPRRILEIGAFRGGSGRIMANALQDNAGGTASRDGVRGEAESMIVGLDPLPLFKVDRSFRDRYRLIAEPSPQAIPKARAAAGGLFDFVLIDGIHTLDAVRDDIAGVLPHLAPGGHIFFHDAYNFGISAAIEEALAINRDLMDMGFLCRSLQPGHRWTGYGGVRLLRREPTQLGAMPEIKTAYAASGMPVPDLDPEILNHDNWFCRVVRPCARCRRVDAEAQSAGAEVG